RVAEVRKTIERRAASEAKRILRSGEDRRLRDMRKIVLNSISGIPTKIDNIVDGGPILSSGQEVGERGVVVSHQTRLGQVGISRPRRNGNGEIVRVNGQVVWDDDNDAIQGVVLMRKNEETLPALRGVKEKLTELNDSLGKLLPGAQLVPHFDLTFL